MSEERKIIIDEGWKAQVEAEREAIRKQESEKQSQPNSGSDSKAAPSADEQFPYLVSMLGTQAMMSMGQIQNPVTNQAETDLTQAKQFIDLLTMLEKKTEGNLTDEESKMLGGFLHELRMLYVHTSQQQSPRKQGD